MKRPRIDDLIKNNPLSREDQVQFIEQVRISIANTNRELDEAMYLDPRKLEEPMNPYPLGRNY